MAKKSQWDAKWIVGGVLAVLAGVGWAWMSGGEKAKIAQIEETQQPVEYVRKGDWEFGTAKVKKGEVAASKQWTYTQKYQEDTEKIYMTAPKKKDLCMTYKLSKEENYDSQKFFNLRVSGLVKPTGVKIESGQQLTVTGIRKWVVTFMDKRKKVLGTGEQEVSVLSPVATKSNAAGALAADNGEGGVSGTTTTNQSLIEIGPNEEEIDKGAAKLAYIKFCLDKSNTDSVDVEISHLEWLLDTRYLGPADQVDQFTIVE